MSVSIVSEDESWTATLDKDFKFDFSTKDGETKLNIVGKDDGKIEGTATLGPIDIGTNDNKISIGGGSQVVKYDGSVKFGKTTVNLLGGHFDLGDGRTDDFQFSFTVEPTLLGPQWTGIATNDFVETKSFDVKGIDVKWKSKKAEVPVYKQKDELFDVAGVIIPGCKFSGWAKNLEFKITMDIAVDGEKVTVTATRALEFQIRPVFKPYPEEKWPKRPPPPPYLGPAKEKVQKITEEILERKSVLQFVDSSLQEVHTWQTVETAINAVTVASAAVATATAAAGLAVAAAAVFAEMNPIADAAEISTAATLATEVAELTAAKGAVTAAKALLKWGAERLSAAIIYARFAATLAVITTGMTAGSTISAAAINKGATTYFEYVAEKYGLKAAGDDLDGMQRILTSIKNEVTSDINTLTEELKQAQKTLTELAEKARKFMEYQTLLESWTADPKHAPFLTWPNANLRLDGSSGDAEVAQLNNINTPQGFAAEATRMESYAMTKGYTGFVIIPHESKAYFRNRGVAELLTTIVQEDYCKGWTSYVKAQNIPMDVLVNRWTVIKGGEQP